MSPHQERTNFVNQNKRGPILRRIKTRFEKVLWKLSLLTKIQFCNPRWDFRQIFSSPESFPHPDLEKQSFILAAIWRISFDATPRRFCDENAKCLIIFTSACHDFPFGNTKKIGTKMSNDQDDITKTCCPSTCHSTAREGFQERQRQHPPETVMILIFPWHVGYSSCFYHSGSSFSSCLFHEQMNRWCYVLHVFTD